MKHLSKLAFGTLLFAFASVSFGQVLVAPPDAVQQEEMGNLASTIGDSFIHMFNAGYNGGSNTNGSIVAQVYVFDAKDEQLVACCSCPLTPDAGATISAKKQLIIDPLTKTPPASITVKLVATLGGNAATDQTAGGSPGFSAGLRADRTTTHITADYPGVENSITEVDFKNVTIALNEYERMVTLCGFIRSNGSGAGLCGGCTSGVATGAPQRD
jgi:hypothetical protein